MDFVPAMGFVPAMQDLRTEVSQTSSGLRCLRLTLSEFFFYVPGSLFILDFAVIGILKSPTDYGLSSDSTTSFYLANTNK